jgi:caa(3)-type oxidase subunit IV
MKIMQMDGQERQVTLVWLGLVALTLGSAWLGEGLASIGITAALVALIVAIKGLLVIRYYMGLAGRGSRLGQVMRLYFVVVPLLILLAGGAGAVLS